MASVRDIFFLVFLLFSLPRFSNAHPLKICKFDKIYQLGDSISDTGNLIREGPIGAASRCSSLPYGQTYFRRATGRCSNGLLMIDFIAGAAGVGLLDAYKNPDGEFSHGANFAVAGATALPTEELASKHIPSQVTNSSLDVQLGWMSTHFNSTCHGKTDCAESFKNTLFMVGEIGGNDYNYALFQAGKTMVELTDMVPDVVAAITDAVKKVIGFGARKVIVPGNFPIGCLPIYLTAFKTNISAAYDEHNCLKELNNFSMYHNEQLQHAIQGLRQENPNVTILYGDYYNAYQYLLRVAPRIGFDIPSIQKACCGIGGSYNFNLTRMCGAPGVPVCPQPHRRISWDGIHLTQRAYKIIADWLMHDFLPKLHCF